MQLLAVSQESLEGQRVVSSGRLSIQPTTGAFVIGPAHKLKRVFRAFAPVSDHWIYLFHAHLQTGLDGARSSNSAEMGVASLGCEFRGRIHVHA